VKRVRVLPYRIFAFRELRSLDDFRRKPERTACRSARTRAWTTIRKLKERVVLHKQLVERRKRNRGEDELKKRLEESVATAENDLKLLREILERI
jgi:hypothetical protein